VGGSPLLELERDKAAQRALRRAVRMEENVKMAAIT